MAVQQVKTIMSEEQLLTRSRSHRNKLIWLFISSFVFMNVALAVKDWSYNIRGWEAEVVYVVFYCVFALAAFSSLAFGALLYGWFKDIKLAKRDREHHGAKILVEMHRSVFGPIP